MVDDRVPRQQNISELKTFSSGYDSLVEKERDD